MKKRFGAKRSTLGLIASGIATIGIAQRMPEYRISLSAKGLDRDVKAIAGDARRAYRKAASREFA